MQASDNRFLVRNPENADLNQYWYSEETIEAMVGEAVEFGAEGTAFLSTPSIYFSMPAAIREKCKVLDLDTKWEKDPGFVRYDFRHPEEIPEALRGTFSMVVIDPPFITRDVWELYAQAANLLLRPGGHVLCSTIAENDVIMDELFGAKAQVYMPCIPHLVYQYCFYTNYETKRLQERNPRIPIDD